MRLAWVPHGRTDYCSKTRVASFYFDALELGNYWGADGEMKRWVSCGL